ncbi:MAG: hypothetical protein JWR07_5543 [Nevskia sp.]|nr:hypothetical protein [Nevskia sp.]
MIVSATPENGPVAESAPSSAALPPAFPALMERLGADGKPAAAVYEELRRRLIVYFRLHLPAEAENLADSVFDRMARKLQEGTEVREVAHYAFGVARLVCFEGRAREQRWREAAADPTLMPEAPAEDAGEDGKQVMHALSECLRQMGARSSELILAYYAADGGEGRRARSRLAAALGLSLNALRNRALRIREALEQCVSGRLKSA